MIERPRLLPAVILGAMGLLVLKLLAWTAQPYPGKVPASAPMLSADIAAAKPQPEAWRQAKATGPGRVPDRFMDPETTGSVDKPDPKTEAAKTDAAKAEAGRPNPNNKADVINGTAPPVSASERAILERLGERREEIEGRMKELEMRERLLESAEKRLDGRVGDLKEMEDKAAPGASAGAEETKAIKSLVIMYEAMKPKDAARVFDRLALDVLVPVVRQMNPRKMSEVLAAMSPERAEKLTIALAAPARKPAPDRQPEPASLPSNELPAIAPPARR